MCPLVRGVSFQKFVIVYFYIGVTFNSNYHTVSSHCHKLKHTHTQSRGFGTLSGIEFAQFY
uniref:Uncharacterized protein n=1 Tax=Octopus bimaculoides TaxID=37653 RepID=A0A0L8IA71_OCTBM